MCDSGERRLPESHINKERKNGFNSFDFAASPQNQTKKIVTSLLSQAKTAIAA
jgi:hypothetical protein